MFQEIECVIHSFQAQCVSIFYLLRTKAQSRLSFDIMFFSVIHQNESGTSLFAKRTIGNFSHGSLSG